jgi:hypothetical protein
MPLPLARMLRQWKPWFHACAASLNTISAAGSSADLFHYLIEQPVCMDAALHELVSFVT